MRRRLDLADQAIQVIHPVDRPAQERAPGYLTALERSNLQNPPVGAYELVDQKLPPKLSVDAQIKLAIHATFDTQKWNQTGSSIPTHVASEPPPERPEVPRPPLK